MGSTYEVGATKEERKTNRVIAELQQDKTTHIRANKRLCVEIVHARRIVERQLHACLKLHRAARKIRACELCREAEDYLTSTETGAVPIWARPKRRAKRIYKKRKAK